MAFKYFPHTDEDIRQMLDTIGVQHLDDLYADVPEEVRLKRDYLLPEAFSEVELRKLFEDMAMHHQPLTVFAGAGCYDHYAPSVVLNLIERSEFLTSYTPYQAEISQGTLHYIFEYQSMMAELTGMDISNASMYDGATATAEAAMMAVASTKKATKVLISETIDPKVLQVVKTYAKFHGIDIGMISQKNGVTDRDDLQRKVTEGGVAGVIVQQPNYYGIVEDYTAFAPLCHEQKALFIMNSVAADLAILKTPGEWGADIAVGEGQSLGIPMSFGGPGIGYMCCTEKLMRKMPGRIVGMTKDRSALPLLRASASLENRRPLGFAAPSSVSESGERAFVLTLQAREQHIRRQRATSNICSNQSLMALYVTIYLSLMGKEGLKEAAELSYAGAHYLYDELLKTGVFKPAFNQPFFNEFCVSYDGDVDTLQEECRQKGFMAGIKIDDHTVMFAVTEQRTKEEILDFVCTIKTLQEGKA